MIRLSNISNLRRMLLTINPDSYVNDPEKNLRMNFIKRGIDARLNKSLSDQDIIINHILIGLDQTPDFINFNNPGLSPEEIQWVNKDIIENSLKYNFIFDYSDQFLDICTRIKTSDYTHRAKLAEEFENLLDRTKNQFRKITIDNDINNIELDLVGDNFTQSVTDIYNIVTNPSRFLKTGMQGLNEMIKFESGRCYILLGITGVGKSMTLLDIALQMKAYNKDFKPRDKSKIPTIVYLTQENTVVETAERIFEMATESNYGMSSYTLDEVLNKLQVEGQLVLTDNNPINLIVKYKPNRSVDTSYLYTLYDDLRDRGYEMIALIQDHLLRMRSVEGNSETRFELGDIVNEFKVFGASKDIPIISNFHLNRDAMKEIESYGKRATHMDVTQKLGKSNVSESVMILNNCDGAIIINKDYDEQNNCFMGFNLIKTRVKTKLFYFAQPFMYGRDIKLVEDVNGPAMFKTSIHGNNEIQTQQNILTSSSNIMDSINNSILGDTEIDTSYLDRDKFSYEGLDLLTPIPVMNEPQETGQIKKPPTMKPIDFDEKLPTASISIDDINNLKDKLSHREDEELIEEKIIKNPIYFIEN